MMIIDDKRKKMYLAIKLAHAFLFLEHTLVCVVEAAWSS